MILRSSRSHRRPRRSHAAAPSAASTTAATTKVAGGASARRRSAKMMVTPALLLLLLLTTTAAVPRCCGAWVPNAAAPRRRLHGTIRRDAFGMPSSTSMPSEFTELRMSSTAEDKKTVGGSGGGKQQLQREQQSHPPHHMHVSFNDGYRTESEIRRSEERMAKARRMLDEFLTDPSGTFVEAQAPTVTTGDDGANGAGADVGGASKSSGEAAADGTKKGKAKKGESSKTKAKNGVAAVNVTAPGEIVLPDTFWYNGNLEESTATLTRDFVTRWQRGVKVAEPLRKYDPVAAEKLLFKQPNRWVVRNVQIALPLGLWAASVVTDVVAGNEKRNRQRRASQLLSSISGLGPAIIKAGQALASRSDLLPSEYLEELQKLQDDVPRFDNDKAFATVEEELGMKFDEVFELIGTEPVAAASIGQVYKARLLSNGDTVAIKIQRPKCEEIIALDLYVLRWWSKWWNRVAELLNRDIDFSSIIDDFGELIYREIDYVAEAANAQRFNELYSGVTDVFVPKVYSELTTSKVLTMEWVDGFRLTDSDSLNAYGLDRKKLVDTLVQCSLRQILENGFFHADPHAGNLLACEDGRLCYLDFGMMSYAAAKQRNGFLLAVVHIVNRDWGELARLYVKLGFIPEGTDLFPIEVALEDALPNVLNAEVSELNFKNVISKLGDIMYTYPFSLPPFYIAIIRCLGVLEGLAIQVDPSSRIISKAYPYIASRVLTDSQDELQEALRRLALTSDGHIRWDRLEGLLDEAKDTEGYDVTRALDQLSDYLLSEDGEQLLNDLAEQIVEGADDLGSETLRYIFDASSALTVNDEVGAVRAFKALQSIFERREESGVDGIGKELRDNLAEVLPEPTPSMQQFGRIAALLGARGSSSDPAKFVPLVRKLAQEPRVQRTASEIVARLGERALSRTLRAVFGLPSPEFESEGSSKTVVKG